MKTSCSLKRQSDNYMENKSIILNMFLNVMRTCSGIIFQLITFPYVSRTLGVDNMGRINYSLSIISYFSLLASLGINIFAQREGAKYRDNDDKFNLIASRIYTLNVLTTLLAAICLYILVLNSDSLSTYRLIILIQSVSIFTTTLGIEWINIVFEDYKAITIRTLLMYLISIVLTYSLVRSPNDITIYVGIQSLVNILICIFNRIHCRKYVKISLIVDWMTLAYLKKSLIFFANNLTITIYVNIDMIMLGSLRTSYDVGIYSVPVKIYSILKTILSSIYIVMISRLTSLIWKKEYGRFKELFTSNTKLLVTLLIPVSFLLFTLSDKTILIMSGPEYAKSTTSLQILSISLVFAILGGLITNCVNLPLNKERVNFLASLSAAIINIILNIIIIPKYGANGAAMSTLVAEFFVFIITIVTFKMRRNIVNIKSIIIELSKVVCGSLIMAFIVAYIQSLSIFASIGNGFIQLLLLAIIALIIYIITQILLRNESIYSLLKIALTQAKNFMAESATCHR